MYQEFSSHPELTSWKVQGRKGHTSWLLRVWGWSPGAGSSKLKPVKKSGFWRNEALRMTE